MIQSPPAACRLWLSVEWMFLFFPEAQPQEKEGRRLIGKAEPFRTVLRQSRKSTRQLTVNEFYSIGKVEPFRTVLRQSRKGTGQLTGLFEIYPTGKAQPQGKEGESGSGTRPLFDRPPTHAGGFDL
jgi:hypothetical protein